MVSGGRGPQIEQAGQLRLARVEALRAVCAFGVIVAHVWGYSHAWAIQDVYGSFGRRAVMSVGLAAIPIFFATSGYLLYLPFARRDFASGEEISLRQYAFNRARRIFPLYWIGLIVVLLAFRGGGSFDQWWKFMTFSEGFFDTSRHPVNSALWTVVVDLHFYLLLPLIALVLARFAKGSLAMGAAGLGLLILASFGVWDYAANGHLTPVRLWHHSLPGSFMFIGAGMMLAMVRVAMDRGPRAWMNGPAGRTDAWLVAALIPVTVAVWNLEYTPLETLSSFLAVGACVLPLRGGTFVRLLDWRPLAVVGLATYSVYFWQGPVIQKIATADWTPGGFGGLLITVLPAIGALTVVSYLLVERPFLRMRRQWARSSAPQVDGPPADELGEAEGDREDEVERQELHTLVPR
jgi:peptidoglycan/LPS O-acetylase OafA/YrhL